MTQSTNLGDRPYIHPKHTANPRYGCYRDMSSRIDNRPNGTRVHPIGLAIMGLWLWPLAPLAIAAMILERTDTRRWATTLQLPS